MDFIILPLLFLLNLTYSNGTGVESESGVIGTTQLIPKKYLDVEIEKEALDLFLDGAFIDVSVTYWLKSKSDHNKVDYAFPIELGLGALQNEINTKTLKKFLPRYSLTLNGKRITHKPVFLDRKLNKEFDFNSDTESNLVVWLVSQFSLLKNQIHILKIKYRIESHTFCTENSHFVEISEDDCIHRFKYHFNPAKNWGSGIIKEFRINLRSWMEFPSMKFASKNYQFSSNQEKGATFIKFQTANFNLNTASHLDFEYINPNLFRKSLFQNKIPLSCVKSIKTSSTLNPNYSSRHLFDGKISTAWITKGLKKDPNPYIEIHFKPQCAYVSQIFITHGFGKDKFNFNSYRLPEKAHTQVEIKNQKGHDDPLDNTFEVEKKLVLPNYLNKNRKYNDFYTNVFTLDSEIDPYPTQYTTKIMIKIKPQAIHNNPRSGMAISELYLVGIKLKKRIEN